MCLSHLDFNYSSYQSGRWLPGQWLRILIQYDLSVGFSVTQELRDLIILILKWSVVITDDPYQLLLSHVVQVGGVAVE